MAASAPRTQSSLDDLRAAKRVLVNRYLFGQDAGIPPSGTIRALAFASAAIGRVSSVHPSDNVVGVGISDKFAGKHMTGELCVKLYVRRKHPAAELSLGQRLPQRVDGISTDVEEVGLIRSSQQRCSLARMQRVVPAPCGISVGHGAVTAGTIGAIVRERGAHDNGRRYLLSNNHVLAHVNAAAIGDPVFQPGPIDGGTPDVNRIGTLVRFVKLDLVGGANVVDCAIVEIQDVAVSKEVCSLGPIKGTLAAQRNMSVFKHGRTTGLTRGVITDVEAHIKVGYGGGAAAVFANQIAIRGVAPTTPFSLGGDSGAAILNADNRICGLLFADSSAADVTWSNQIADVMRGLRVQLA